MPNSFLENRIVSKDDPLVAQLLKDFRWSVDGKSLVARVHGAGKFPSAMIEVKEEHVMLEFSPSAEWTRPHLLLRWLVALRLPYLSVSLFPLLLVLFTFWKAFGLFAQWPVALLTIAATSFLHIGCNLWDDYEDHLRGVDSPESEGGSGVIRNLWIPAVHIQKAAAIFFLTGFFLGATLLLELPWAASGKYLLLIGLLGSFLAASYSGWPFHYKYFALGEPIVFLLGGPLITAGATNIFFQSTEPMPHMALMSLPLSFLVTLRLHLGNMQRIPFDSVTGSLTIANLAGFSWSKKMAGFLFLSPFLCSAVLFAFHIIGLRQVLFPILSLLTLVYAFYELKDVSGPLHPACKALRKCALHLHLSFASLYVISFLF